MGYIKHHAIVVTTFIEKEIIKARKKAINLGLYPSEVFVDDNNGYRSICIFPDGSKEGWTASKEGDIKREMFKNFLMSQRYDDNSSPYCWFEASYSSDDREAKIVSHEYNVALKG